MFFFACNKRIKKIYNSSLKYKVFEYPKEENKRYILGEYLNQIILKK